MDKRFPYPPGAEDFFSFFRFLDNRKEFDGYIKLLQRRMDEFRAAAIQLTKAEDIDKLYADAETAAKAAHEAASKLKSDAKRQIDAKLSSLDADRRKLDHAAEQLAEETRSKRAEMEAARAELDTAHQTLARDLKKFKTEQNAVAKRVAALDEREANLEARETKMAEKEEILNNASRAFQ